MWIWGKLATWFLRRHIAHEIRPETERQGRSREDAYRASCNKLRAHFDAAWPVN